MRPRWGALCEVDHRINLGAWAESIYRQPPLPRSSWVHRRQRQWRTITVTLCEREIAAARVAEDSFRPEAGRLGYLGLPRPSNPSVDGLTAACVRQCALGQLDGLEEAPDAVRSIAVLLHENAGLFEKIARAAQKLDCGQMAMVGAVKRVVARGGPD